MGVLDIGKVRAAPLQRDPFDHLVVLDVIALEAAPAIGRDYPAIDRPGNFALQDLRYGPMFDAFVGALRSPELAEALGEKFGIELVGRPTVVTVRGHCGPRDGDIHTDDRNKIVSVLVYLNADWQGSGGALRLLRSPEDIDDYAVEVPPLAGTLLAFRRTDSSYHGFRRYVGPRRTVQLNYIRDEAALRALQGRWKPWRKARKVLVNALRGGTGY